MPFQKGHKLAKGGARPNSGPKPNPIKQMVDSGDYSADPDVQSVIDFLRKVVDDGAEDTRNRIAAAKEYLDRKVGKAKERKEVDVNANIILVDDLR